MEARHAETGTTETTETIYGNSLRLNIPRVTCRDVDCTKENIFTPRDVAVDLIIAANESILHLINCFVDFFIQYQTDQTEEYFEPNLQTLKELKKIIFLLCVESTCIEAFSQILRDCITPRNEFKIIQNVGNPESSLTQDIQNVEPKQRSTILFILVLSYNVLSFSGSLGIRIKDISDIIQSENQRKLEGKQSFILQFLPPGKETNCFQKAYDFVFKEGKIIPTIFQKISSLSRVGADSGGSKRVLKKYNKSRKNKYKHKYNHKYKKSKRYRRKRTQSNQNKMF